MTNVRFFSKFKTTWVCYLSEFCMVLKNKLTNNYSNNADQRYAHSAAYETNES